MGLRVNRYGPVRTIVVVRSVPRTEVPAARNSLRESTKRSTAQRVTKGPSSPSVDGTKGSGQEWFSAIPNRIADTNTIGGLSKPGSGPPPGPVSALLLIFSREYGREIPLYLSATFGDPQIQVNKCSPPAASISC